MCSVVSLPFTPLCAHCTSRLYLVAPGFPGPLPDIHPGALQGLQEMQITARSLTNLPSSWGSHPSVLPALKNLRLNMLFAGSLPAVWSGGFRQLQFLIIWRLDLADGHTMIISAPPVLPGPKRGGHAVLPNDWAAGFPNLLHLQLHGLAITGSVPNGWITTGFPKLDAL